SALHREALGGAGQEEGFSRRAPPRLPPDPGRRADARPIPGLLPAPRPERRRSRRAASNPASRTHRNTGELTWLNRSSRSLSSCTQNRPRAAHQTKSSPPPWRESESTQRPAMASLTAQIFAGRGPPDPLHPRITPKTHRRNTLAQIAFTGNIVAQPEIKFAASGKAVAKARLAENHRGKNPQTGEWEDQGTSWRNLVAFGAQAEKLAEVPKGSPLVVIGRETARKYEK